MALADCWAQAPQPTGLAQGLACPKHRRTAGPEELQSARWRPPPGTGPAPAPHARPARPTGPTARRVLPQVQAAFELARLSRPWPVPLWSSLGAWQTTPKESTAPPVRVQPIRSDAPMSWQSGGSEALAESGELVVWTGGHPPIWLVTQRHWASAPPGPPRAGRLAQLPAESAIRMDSL
jgi:hypothetical protein